MPPKATERNFAMGPAKQQIFDIVDMFPIEVFTAPCAIRLAPIG
jgi:hypothetical protein